MILVDTSALYALADQGDPHHAEARARLHAALEAREPLITHNYVLVEAMALIQHRLGLPAALKRAAPRPSRSSGWTRASMRRRSSGWPEPPAGP